MALGRPVRGRLCRRASVAAAVVLALGLSVGTAQAGTSETFCVTASAGSATYPGCSGTSEVGLAAALTAADAAEPGTETLYLGPGTYSAPNGFVDASGANPISIIGDGESNTTLTTGTADGQVMDFTDREGAQVDSQSSISDLTVDMNDGGIGLDVPQHVTNVAITDSGPGSGTALWSQNTAVNNVTITMNESSPTVGIYRPNGTLTANGLTITANTGINGNGSNDSYTGLRIFANGLRDPAERLQREPHLERHAHRLGDCDDRCEHGARLGRGEHAAWNARREFPDNRR